MTSTALQKLLMQKVYKSNVKPLLASQENKLLVGKKNKKTVFLAKGISEGCYTKNHLGEYKCLPGYTCRRI